MAIVFKSDYKRTHYLSDSCLRVIRSRIATRRKASASANQNGVVMKSQLFWLTRLFSISIVIPFSFRLYQLIACETIWCCIFDCQPNYHERNENVCAQNICIQYDWSLAYISMNFICWACLAHWQALILIVAFAKLAPEIKGQTIMRSACIYLEMYGAWFSVLLHSCCYCCQFCGGFCPCVVKVDALYCNVRRVVITSKWKTCVHKQAMLFSSAMHVVWLFSNGLTRQFKMEWIAQTWWFPSVAWKCI